MFLAKIKKSLICRALEEEAATKLPVSCPCIGSGREPVGPEQVFWVAGFVVGVTAS